MTEDFDGLLADSDQSVSRLISELRIEADESHFEELAQPAVALGSQGQRVARWRPGAAAAIAASIALIAAFSGTAWAAHGADPGDRLYGLDRAPEAIGIGDGGAAERFEEVKSLVDQNQLNRGLEHAADALADHPDAQSALSAAADRVADVDASSVQVDVAELLSYLSTNVGSIEGDKVAAYARAIGPGPVDPPSGVPPVVPPPGGPSVDVPPAGVTPVGPPSGVPPVGVTPVGPPSGVPPVDVPQP